MRNKLKDIEKLENIFTIKISHNSIKLKYKDKKEEFDYRHIVENMQPTLIRIIRQLKRNLVNMAKIRI